MKRNTYAITLILILLLTSCHSNDNITTIKEFPLVKELIREEIPTPPILYNPVSLLMLDSAIVTLDLKTDTLFQVFKLPSFKYIGGFIHRGEGPDEEIFVDPFMQRLTNNQFIFRNLTGVKIAKFDTFTDSIKVINTIKLTNDVADLFHTFMLNHKIIGIKADFTTKKEFISYNPKNHEANDFGQDYPTVSKHIKIADKNKIQLFAKANTVKPDGTAFACVYDKFPILRIYTNTGKLKKEIRLDNNQSFPYALTKDEPTIGEINEMMQNYRMIKSTDHFIYALYIGKKNKDLPPGLNDFSNIIHVWDWEGNPIMELKLDKDIFTFDISNHDEFIICSSLEKLNGFYKYKLPVNLLKKNLNNGTVSNSEHEKERAHNI